MTPEQLGEVDLAEMNLLCATGLPGAEDLDIDRCRVRLNQWAARVQHETDRHLYKFYQNPLDYNNSQGYFRILTLVTVLQQDCGVHYNMDRIRDIDFRRSQDLFIHGMIGRDNGGTCVSMPVMYTVVGRRLGYPMKLVLAKGHVFCRWDAPEEQFNIEGTNRGLNTFDDAYYKTWPHPMTEAEVKAGRYLTSLSRAEELACFLASRAHCLLENGRTKEAVEAYAAAHRLAPKDPAYLAWAGQAEARLRAPTLGATRPDRIREPPLVYRGDPLAEAKRIDAFNRANMQRTMPGVLQRPVPPRPYADATQPHQPRLPGRPPR